VEERILGQAVRDRPGEYRNGILPVLFISSSSLFLPYVDFKYNLRMKLLIWEERAKKNMSLRQLAARTGISHAALNNYENGNRYPTIEQLERIAKALHIKISDLYDSDFK
jgi:DNA-binding XRE family transcriptional regulator